MNLQNKRWAIVFILIISCIVAISFGLDTLSKISKGDTGKNIFGKQILPPGTPADIETYRGIIEEGTRGYNIYTSKKYDIQFSFPKEWFVGGNGGLLGYGGVKFSNYPESEEPEFALSETGGKNTIEVDIGNDSFYRETGEIYSQSPDIKKQDKKQVVIAGQPAVRFDIEGKLWGGASRELVYYIILARNQNYLKFHMYGDPSNFHILDEMVKTIKFLPVEKGW